MALAKVKLTEQTGGQEYLLAATKMNLKGILVETRRTFPLGTKVQLSIQLEDGHPLELQGEVHKIADRAGGGTGMIIRFVDPPPEALNRIEAFGRRAERLPHPKSPELLSQERTMMVDMDTLGRLSVASPDEDDGHVASTVDEEAVHAANPGFGGATRVADMGQIDRRFTRKKKASPARWFTIIAILFLVSLTLVFSSRRILRFLDRTFGLKSPTELPTKIDPPEPARPVPQAASKVAEAPTPSPTSTSPIRTPPPAELPKLEPTAPSQEELATSRIETMAIEKEETFVKVTISGEANFARATATRSMRPRRLIVEIPNVTSFSYAAVIPVSEKPLLRVRTEKSKKGIRITLDLYPVEFPRYDLKPHTDSLDIFLHR